MELYSSCHDQVSNRERIPAQASCSISGFGTVEAVNCVSSPTALLRMKVKRQLHDWLFCKDQAIGWFDQPLKSAYHIWSSAIKKSKSQAETEYGKMRKCLKINEWMQNIYHWLCYKEQHVLVFKGKQKEISVVHLQTRLSPRIDASREAWKETTGQAMAVFSQQGSIANK